MRARIARLQLGEEHIELIEYLAPQGRPIPMDAVQTGGGRLVSPGSVAMEQAVFKAGMLVRGPSGHALLLIDQ